jgi:hypothetical protein
MKQINNKTFSLLLTEETYSSPSSFGLYRGRDGPDSHYPEIRTTEAPYVTHKNSSLSAKVKLLKVKILYPTVYDDDNPSTYGTTAPSGPWPPPKDASILLYP